MFDPLNSTAAFADVESQEQPPWPTTPHPPGSPVPNLRPAASSSSSTRVDGPSSGLYGREPQIYGQPEAGLISPRETVSSNGTSFEKLEPYLRVRVTGLDRNRRDILVKFDAQTNLSNFTGTAYRNVSRSFLEFQQFYESIVQNNPQTIVPALPLSQTSAPTDEEDDRLVKIMLQRWFTRVCEDPILVGDEDVRAFIENDFGYQPTPRPRKKASSGFSLIKRHVPDEDEELLRARFELTKLEGQFFEAAKAVDKLAVTRKALASAHVEMGNKLINVATTEAHPPLGNALRKIGRTWHSLADLDHAQSISECVILADSLGYQGMNARSAKETLQMRTGVLEEYQAAVKTTISKRRHIERLKASSNIRPEKVDEALTDMEEADRYEQILAKRAEGISQNLHRALENHNRYANDDITTALIEHARSSIMYERQLLKELEALRVDVGNAAKKVLPAMAPPKPRVIPPLEDFHDQPRSAPAAPNGLHPTRSDLPNLPNTSFNPSGQSKLEPPRSADPLSASQIGNPSQVPPMHSQPSIDSSQTSSSQNPLTDGMASPQPSRQQPPSPSVTHPSTIPQSQPVSPSISQGLSHSSLPPQSPTTSLSAVKPPSREPPLGGRLVDESKSVFIKPPSSNLQVGPTNMSASTSHLPSSQPFDPLRSGMVPRPATASPLHEPQARPVASQQNLGLDPLGQIKPHQMSQSMRIQPTRPRLDAKEAASKLANMF